ncbi:MAG: hypothetical protein LAT64_01125 [Phycisphaerales bacterium]|nr:hypothetical protein [Planctomycetota bacterium]MCH8507364.1 hypothetical protein [Phycisphaerales bacterium]
MHRNTRLVLAALAAALIAFAIYYAIAARAYFTAPPAPPDPIAALNAALPQAPEPDRAAPAYAALHEAWQAARPEPPDPLPYDWWNDLRPGHPDFEPVAAAIRTLEPRLAEAREASTRPVLGDRLEPATAERRREWGRPELDEAMTHALINAHIPALTHTSVTIRLLLVDAQHAAANDDPARFAADLHAALGAARQIRDIPLFINDIIAIRAVASTAAVIRRTLTDHPDLLDAPALTALQDDLADTARNHAVLRIDSERTNIADLIDRSFSPGPRGRITAAGIERLKPMVQFGDPDRTMFPAIPNPRSPLAPLQARRVSHRAGQLDWYDTYLTLVQAAQAGGPTSVASFTGQEGTYLYGDRIEYRYAPIWSMVPAIGSMLYTEQHTRLEAEATITALAVERYRRDHARLPDTLDQLVPAYLAAIPADPYDLTPGARIKYRPTADTFTIYYNGANAKDNNATPPPHDPQDPNAARRFHTGQPHPNAPEADWILYPPPN